MLAEIKNKNVSDTSEDQLTGNFFGVLRYISFNDGLKKILKAVQGSNKVIKLVEDIECDDWSTYLDLWHKIGMDRDEPDVLLSFKNVDILIEVKLDSGLSSDDEIRDPFKSKNQLSRYSRLLLEKEDKTKKEKVIIFLAKDLNAYELWQDSIDRNKICPGVHFGYLSWQRIYNVLIEMKYALEYPGKIITDDLIKLFDKKNLNPFSEFTAVDIDENMIWNFDNVV